MYGDRGTCTRTARGEGGDECCQAGGREEDAHWETGQEKEKAHNHTDGESATAGGEGAHTSEHRSGVDVSVFEAEQDGIPHRGNDGAALPFENAWV